MSKDEDAVRAQQAQVVKKFADLLTVDYVAEFERMKLVAKFQRMRYEAAVAAGFTEVQALHLCTLT